MKKLLPILFLVLAFSTQVFAVDFTVNLTTDQQDANISDNVCDIDLAATGLQCTLRAAVEQANALAGADTITFALATPATINLTIGELVVSQDVTITGPGARLLTVQRSTAAPNFRVFLITSIAGTVNISGITIANGNATTGFNNIGGGIYNQGGAQSITGRILNLTEVTVRNNSSILGGGIANRSILNVTRSTISSNTAINFGSGGGIHNISPPTNVIAIANISNTTISDNTAFSGSGGGIANISSSLTLNNVTISNNSALGPAGPNPVTGGGVYHPVSGTDRIAVVRNTIIAQNNSPANPDVSGNFDSLGNNLIGSVGTATGFFNGVNGDIVGTIASPINPLLGVLQNNGGETDTRALLPGSPAIDAGNNCVVTATCPSGNPPTPLTTDQRGTGFVRLQGTAVDIGAFEFASTAPPSNLLINSSFEHGLAPWQDGGNSSLEANPHAPQGSFELRIGTGTGGIFQTVAAEANTTYTLSGWGRVTAGETGWIGVHYLDSEGNEIATQSLIEFTNTAYEQKQVTLQTPSNTAQLRVWVLKNEGAGYFFVDEISLTR